MRPYLARDASPKRRRIVAEQEDDIVHRPVKLVFAKRSFAIFWPEVY